MDSNNCQRNPVNTFFTCFPNSDYRKRNSRFNVSVYYKYAYYLLCLLNDDLYCVTMENSKNYKKTKDRVKRTYKKVIQIELGNENRIKIYPNMLNNSKLFNKIF